LGSFEDDVLGRKSHKKLHLSNTLRTIKMEEGSQIIEFLKSIKELQTQLVIVGEKVEYAVLIQIMLNALSLSYRGLIQTITT
jgi:enterochelin esterase-like enzyme